MTNRKTRKKKKSFNEKKSKCRICCEYQKQGKRTKKYLKKDNYYLIHPKLDSYNNPICNDSKYLIKNSCNIFNRVWS